MILKLLSIMLDQLYSWQNSQQDRTVDSWTQNDKVLFLNSQFFTWVYKQRCKLVSGSTRIATNSPKFMLFGLSRRAKGPFWSLLGLFCPYLGAWDISRDPQMAFWAYPGVLGGLIGLHKGVQRPFWIYPRGWGAFWVNTRGIWNPLSLSRVAWRAFSTYTGGSGAIFGLSSGPQGPFWTYPGGSETILHISREVRGPLGL